MADTHVIEYERLAQEAMRGVVRTVLQGVQKSGLPGDHHFYIAFDTRHPGVVLSRRLRAKYPEEMTIVLQHLFTDLIAGDARFEVKLSFDGIPERLAIPYTAVKVFLDPSVPFSLMFEEATVAAGAAPAEGAPGERGREGSLPTIVSDGGGAVRPGPRAIPSERVEKKRAPRRTRVEREGETAVFASGANEHNAPSVKDVDGSIKGGAEAIATGGGDGGTPSDGGSGKVVSLDRFRKKP